MNIKYVGIIYIILLSDREIRIIREFIKEAVRSKYLYEMGGEQ